MFLIDQQTVRKPYHIDNIWMVSMQNVYPYELSDENFGQKTSHICYIEKVAPLYVSSYDMVDH